MSLKQRLHQIEAMLESMDPDSAEYAKLDSEANDIADQLNEIDDIYTKRAMEEFRLKEEKLEDIIRLNAEGKVEQLIDKYGHEFIDDYEVIGDTIHSKVAPEHGDSQWTVKDTQKKLRQLLYYRIYDRYIRTIH